MHSASGNSENLRRQSGRLVSSAKRVLRCEARYGPTGVVGYVGLLITSDSLAQSLGSGSVRWQALRSSLSLPPPSTEIEKSHASCRTCERVEMKIDRAPVLGRTPVVAEFIAVIIAGKKWQVRKQTGK